MLAAIGAVMLGAATTAHAPLVGVLGGIEPGNWELRETGSAAPPQMMCVRDPDMLLQLRHAGRQCARFVVDDEPTTAIVHYTCPGAGHGRTTIRIENPQSFLLDTQGIVAGAPFDVHYEARRTGPCADRGH